MKKFLLTILSVALMGFTATAEHVDLSFEAMGSQAGGWNSSYSSHTYDTDACTVVFSSASKQGSTITDVPVQKAGDVTITLKDGATFSSVKFNFKQWTTKASTAALKYSTDGTTFKDFTPAISNKTINASNLLIEAATVPENAIAVKLTTTGKNQVGIASIDYTASQVSGPKDFNSAAFKEYNLKEGDQVTLDLVAGAPAVTLTSSATDVASIDGLTITAVTEGTAVITAAWAAVPDKWNEGSVTFNVNVKVAPEGQYIAFLSNESDQTTPLTTNNFTDQVEEGAEYISGVTSTANVYGGQYGLKFSSSTKDGSVTINLANAVNCEKIIVLACNFNATAGELAVNGGNAITLDSNKGDLKEYTFDINARIESVTLAATNRLYVKSILIVPVAEFVKPLELSLPAWNVAEGRMWLFYSFAVQNSSAKPEITMTVVNSTTQEPIECAVEVEPIESKQEKAASPVHQYAGKITATSEAFKDAASSFVATVNVKVGTATTSAQNGKFDTSGVENVEIEAAQAAEYYDLAGRKVENPAAGVYVRVAGGKATKVIIR